MSGIQFTSKGVITSGGTIPKTVFYEVSVGGAIINGTTYQASQVINQIATSNVLSDRTNYVGSYSIGAWTLIVNYDLYKDGRFDFTSHFIGTLPNSSTSIFLKVDYDLDGASNDIVEDIRSFNGILQWHAPTLEETRAYPNASRITPNTIENTAYCRIVDATDPRDQFYAVFWPSKLNGADNSAVSFSYKHYGTNTGIIPPTLSGNAVQQTHTDASGYFRTYAWGGNDQLMYIKLTRAPSANFYGIAGKVFQKPAGRSLKVNHYVQNGFSIPQGWISTTMGNGRSAIDAMNDLTDGKWQMGTYTGTYPNPYSGGSITTAQLHELMYVWRTTAGANSGSQKENFRDWHIDILSVNSTLAPSPAAEGIMFDPFAIYASGSVPPSEISNATVREGAAILWGATGSVRSDAFVHELGHALHMHHWWVDAPGGYNNIMSGIWVADPFMTWGEWGLEWVRRGPESWVKPGRFGNYSEFKRRRFREYGTGAWVIPTGEN